MRKKTTKYAVPSLYFDAERLQIAEKKSTFFSFRTLLLVSVSCFLFLFAMYGIFSFIQKGETTQELEMSKLELKIENLTNKLLEVRSHDQNLLRSVLGMDTLPQEIWNAGIGGVDRYSHLNSFENAELIINLSKKIDNIESKIKVQKESLESITSFYENKRNLIAQTPLIEPVLRKGKIRHTSGFGTRTDPFFKTKKFHYGIDFSAPIGTNIIATADGIVHKIRKKRTGYGIEVIIKHNEHYSTRYAHLSKILVKTGEKVVRGAVIAKSGNSGRSTAPHLHYEVFFKEKRVNPFKYIVSELSIEDYNQIARLAKAENVSLD